MTNPFLAQIGMFAGNFAIRDWAYCNGQLQAISQNSALFSLVGTFYGGDGRTTFGLPDLRGRVAINAGGGSTGPGLSPYRVGQMSGLEWVTLNVLEMPSHFHTASMSVTGTVTAPITGNGSIKCDSTGNDNTNSPVGKYIGTPPTGGGKQAAIFSATQNDSMAADGVAISGSATIPFGTIPSSAWDISVAPAGGSQSHTNIQPYLAVNYLIALQGVYPSRN